jgi:hypothetical protein
MIEAALRAVLIANAGVTALVGTRVYVGILPQDPTYPALTIQPVGYNADNHLTDAGDLQWDRLQIDAWGETYAATHQLYKAAIDAINGNDFSGTGYRIGSVTVQVGGGYRYEESVKIHRRHFDVGIWFELT